MTYVIEKNIPTPSKITKERPPIEKMEIGDSVVVAAKTCGAASITFSANAVRMGAPYSAYKFKSADIGGGSFRVWRVA